MKSFLKTIEPFTQLYINPDFQLYLSYGTDGGWKSGTRMLKCLDIIERQ